MKFLFEKLIRKTERIILCYKKIEKDEREIINIPLYKLCGETLEFSFGFTLPSEHNIST